jgi:N-acetyl-anhydromuramyl-L-alanine amidase AmpD
MSVYDHLRKRGINVEQFEDGLKPGRPGSFDPRYVVIHHDASKVGPSPALARYIWRGTSTVPGPLSQFWYSFGKTVVLSLGRANHAGRGGPWAGVDGTVPRDSMNAYSFGVEWDHTTGENVKSAEYAALVKLLAALCDYCDVRRKSRKGARRLLAHKEWAPGRKVDPDIDMNRLRLDVQRVIDGWYARPTLPPGWRGRTLRRGMGGKDVAMMQGFLISAGFDIPSLSSGRVRYGYYGAETERAVKSFKRRVMKVAVPTDAVTLSVYRRIVQAASR